MVDGYSYTLTAGHQDKQSSHQRVDKAINHQSKDASNGSIVGSLPVTTRKG